MNIFTIIALWIALLGNMDDQNRVDACEGITVQAEAFNAMGADLYVNEDCSVEFID